jgi:hypothetical protein
MKTALGGFFFQDISEARERIVAILRSIPLGTFLQVFDEWKESWQNAYHATGNISQRLNPYMQREKIYSGDRTFRTTGGSSSPP